MQKVHDEHNIKILNKNRISPSDFPFFLNLNMACHGTE